MCYIKLIMDWIKENVLAVQEDFRGVMDLS
jgi:hypothetical protein